MLAPPPIFATDDDDSTVVLNHNEAFSGCLADGTAQQEVVLSVYWCGTAGHLGPPTGPTTQVGMFFSLTDGVDITDAGPPLIRRELAAGARHFKMGFDGCGVTNGLLGTVFAAGLGAQCRQVVDRVHSLLSERFSVALNVLGLSRGGMAAMKLVGLLAAADPARVSMAVCLFDPVPGNLIATARLDALLCGGRMSIARQCIDLSSSQNLRSVLAIYPYEPLPDFAFHAPILPRYPRGCAVENLVTLGCHQGALWRPDLSVFDQSRTYYAVEDLAGSLSFLSIFDFLAANRTRLRQPTSCALTEGRLHRLVHALEQEVTRSEPSRRVAHAPAGRLWIVRRAVPIHLPTAQAQPRTFLNRQHQQLAIAAGYQTAADNSSVHMLLAVESEETMRVRL